MTTQVTVSVNGPSYETVVTKKDSTGAVIGTPTKVRGGVDGPASQQFYLGQGQTIELTEQCVGAESKTLTRDQAIEAFRRWNEQATAGQWEPRDDPEAAADHFLSLIAQAA